jgi:hypothetical protein
MSLSAMGCGGIIMAYRIAICAVTALKIDLDYKFPAMLCALRRRDN